jgi:hypothetical protein
MTLIMQKSHRRGHTMKAFVGSIGVALPSHLGPRVVPPHVSA